MESTVTFVTFKITAGKKFNEKTLRNETYWREINLCFMKETDEQIHEQLHGWDLNYQLQKVIRLNNCVMSESTDKVFSAIIVLYSVMSVPQTELFFDKSAKQITEELNKRDYQSYHIYTTIQSTGYRFDALNSITRFKDTN